MTAREDAETWRAHQRLFNSVFYGTEEPTAEQFGQYFDRRFGTWLPDGLVKRLGPTA